LHQQDISTQQGRSHSLLWSAAAAALAQDFLMQCSNPRLNAIRRFVCLHAWLLPQVNPTAPGCCRVEHVLAVKPMLAIPAAVAPYTSSIFKKQVALLLQDLQAEIERQAAAQAAAN
jgi:hypothetical protein